MNKKEERVLEHQALIQLIEILDKRNERGGRVWNVVDLELTPRQREEVLLYYKNEMTMTEIAEKLGISPSSVSRTINRGKTRLRKFLRYNGRGLMSFLDD